MINISRKVLRVRLSISWNEKKEMALALHCDILKLVCVFCFMELHDIMKEVYFSECLLRFGSLRKPLLLIFE